MTTRFRASLLASTLLFAGSAVAAPVTYTLDPGHTQVFATWTHMGFSKPSAGFPIGSGTLNWDAENPTASSVSVEFPMGKITTLVPKLDEHLSAADFFDVAQFPSARFESTAVEVADGEGHYRVTGTLTIKDQSKPVTLDVQLNGSGEHPMRKVPAIGFNATATIKRSDFGVGAYAPAVSDEIELHITTEAVAAKPAP